MFYIKIYDRLHNILDEVHEIEVKNYMHTLNGINKFVFSIPLRCNKFTSVNFTEMNHIELYEDNNLIWFGVITNINFNNPSVEIGCLGYLHLLEKLRLTKKNYYNITYGNLICKLLETTENTTGIKIGRIENDIVKTDRVIENTDMYLDKVIDLIEELNYYIDVDKNRNLNFYMSKGEYKSHLVLKESTEFSNIVSVPSISKSTDNLANCIYAESTYTVENYSNTFATNSQVTLTSVARDEESIKKYGRLDSVLSVNEIRIQETLDKYVKAELDKVAYPSLNITLEVVDSAICPMNEVEVGDWVTINLESYFNLEQKVRIIEIDRDVIKNTYKLTVGNVLYREKKITTKKYII